MVLLWFNFGNANWKMSAAEERLLQTSAPTWPSDAVAERAEQSLEHHPMHIQCFPGVARLLVKPRDWFSVLIS
jgi:hypothetical protein